VLASHPRLHYRHQSLGYKIPSPPPRSFHHLSRLVALAGLSQRPFKSSRSALANTK
jgi:hypothetical protein